MSVRALVNKAVASLRNQPDLARLLRRLSNGPQQLFQRDLLVPVGTLDPTDYTFLNPFAQPGVTPANSFVLLTGLFVTPVVPSPAGSYVVSVGTTLGGVELLTAQTFNNPQTRGDTRGITVAQLGASFAAAANYRALLAGSADLFVRVDPTVIADGGKVRVLIMGHPILP
jgi:hypothetical protein